MKTQLHRPSEIPVPAIAPPDETCRVKVILLDHDGLPMARGMASLPLLLESGVFWHDCPMPSDGQLAAAKAFKLESGEMLVVGGLNLCAGDPPHYNFGVSRP